MAVRTFLVSLSAVSVRALLADADFVSGPEGSCGVVADDWFALALYFYDCGGLVGGLEWEAG